MENKRIVKLARNLLNHSIKLNKGENILVEIVGNGTDLTFSIDDIPAEKYMGTFNIPDGEIATAPVKNSVNGYYSMKK